MNPEPRHQSEYSPRQTQAAHRVLVDLGQVLASFQDCIVVVGGWVPDLLITQADDPHVGSIDVDLALDAGKLGDGRYAELLKLLIGTHRYRPGTKPFQLVTVVDLSDGEKPVQVEVEFLAPKEVKLTKNRPKHMKAFRVLQADGCGAAFHAPKKIEVRGKMIEGAKNRVQLRVASLPDFLVMKAHALAGRDKPKDAYDLCYCLDHFPGGLAKLADDWNNRRKQKDLNRAIEILRQKFSSVKDFGPRQIVEFFDVSTSEEQEMQARRAFELVQKLLSLL